MADYEAGRMKSKVMPSTTPIRGPLREVDMKDVINQYGAGHNDGIATEKATMGQQLVRAFGKDGGDLVGDRSTEREAIMNGGCNDLSHSLKGVQANE